MSSVVKFNKKSNRLYAKGKLLPDLLDTRIMRYTLNSFEGFCDKDQVLEEYELNKHIGHVIDSKQHDSILYRGDLCLGCSFMTFVIKNDLEKLSNNNKKITNEFDIDPYNYVFNDSTAFIDSKFASDHPRQLEDLLLRIEAYDIKYFKQLNFVRIEKDECPKQDKERRRRGETRKNVSLIHLCLDVNKTDDTKA